MPAMHLTVMKCISSAMNPRIVPSSTLIRITGSIIPKPQHTTAILTSHVSLILSWWVIYRFATNLTDLLIRVYRHNRCHYHHRHPQKRNGRPGTQSVFLNREE